MRYQRWEWSENDVFKPTKEEEVEASKRKWLEELTEQLKYLRKVEERKRATYNWFKR